MTIGSGRIEIGSSQPEKAESGGETAQEVVQEIQAVNEATFEPEAVVARVGECQQAEEIEQAFVAAVEAAAPVSEEGTGVEQAPPTEAATETGTPEPTQINLDGIQDTQVQTPEAGVVPEILSGTGNPEAESSIDLTDRQSLEIEPEASVDAVQSEVQAPEAQVSADGDLISRVNEIQADLGEAVELGQTVAMEGGESLGTVQAVEEIGYQGEELNPEGLVDTEGNLGKLELEEAVSPEEALGVELPGGGKFDGLDSLTGVMDGPPGSDDESWTDSKSPLPPGRDDSDLTSYVGKPDPRLAADRGGDRSDDTYTITYSSEDRMDNHGNQFIRQYEEYDNGKTIMVIFTTFYNGEGYQTVVVTDKNTGEVLQSDQSKIIPNPDSTDGHYEPGDIPIPRFPDDPMSQPLDKAETMMQPSGDGWDERNAQRPPVNWGQAMAFNLSRYTLGTAEGEETVAGVPSGSSRVKVKKGEELIDPRKPEEGGSISQNN